MCMQKLKTSVGFTAFMSQGAPKVGNLIRNSQTLSWEPRCKEEAKVNTRMPLSSKDYDRPDSEQRKEKKKKNPWEVVPTRWTLNIFAVKN